ncbi:hypothetical protein HETIRDRAFT_331125 [Heterobasidion irregulare TC 32-1]|uniref:Uncharacterized protein n=1 Tax=Heterobasidion irregulare (strain TC 32-1) TaxID=747525 RepID=W4JPE2_HETIT|nr:uncharacterized protein HETIRDRAFT_331125 [Heterobasidion irregulare TC 32-1]ETW75437.1 hypothetical protein HETIRDRAFT_331125 [Heterobasidion irregulare TC 32-1]
MDYDRYDALLHYIFKQTQGDAWFRPDAAPAPVPAPAPAPTPPIAGGVCMRDDAGAYRVFPYEDRRLEPFERAVSAMGLLVAVKVRSAAAHAAVGEVGPDEKSVYVDANTRIQIVETMMLLPHADREQKAAFVRDERVLVVWSDALDAIIPTCSDFEERLIRLLWRARPPTSTAGTAPSRPPTASYADSAHSPTPARVLAGGALADEQHLGVGMGVGVGADADVERRVRGARPVVRRTWYGRRYIIAGSDAAEDEGDEEREKEKDAGVEGDVDALRGPERRPVVMYAAVYNGLAAGLSAVFIGNGVKNLIVEWRQDGSFVRFALAAVLPLLFCVSLFFCIQIVQNVTMAIGPIAQYHRNSKFYSARKPRPNARVDDALPHITIQMPVYKEGLEGVLAPSVASLKKAMQTYARQGGTSNIFVNDDGLQLLGDRERSARIAFYDAHGIGWVARPPHGGAGGFVRAGRFKKASNMNYGLALSRKAEQHLLAIQAQEQEQALRASVAMEERALMAAVEEVYEESGRRWRPWAKNGRACRLGEIILLVDSDTVVPEDCLRDAAREMAECPTVAIIQHESDVIQVAHHYFENGIAYFTKRINKCISMTCANGEVAPFVGHNAFLRWKAIQDAAFVDAADGQEKIWSEAHVSEDFDMALRLQMRGFIIRWATYSKGGFKEGVSLTVDDELNRWQKYAYGAVFRLLFNPFVHWWRRGPIAHQIHKFLWSDAPLHYKISMMAYMFSYYGLSASVTIGLINYVLLGFEFPVDGFYMHSFEIWLASIVVFFGSGNVGYTLLEYRLGEKNLLESFFTNLLWIPFFFFFFGGLAIPLSQAMLAHLFSYDISWGATKKEVERSNFFKEVPKIMKRFWFPLLVTIILIFAMIILSTSLVPLEWRVDGSGWAVIFPLAIACGCHVLFPIVLNPWLMIFSY